MARPVVGCPSRGREPARRSAALMPAELDPVEDPDEMRAEEPDRVDPDDEPPELTPDPLRGAAEPDLPLEEEDGVREPA